MQPSRPTKILPLSSECTSGWQSSMAPALNTSTTSTRSVSLSLPCSPTAPKTASLLKPYAALIEAFGTWEAVRDAPAEAVEAAIKPCTWPEQKAPRIQQVLRDITAQKGTLSLDFPGRAGSSGSAGLAGGFARRWPQNERCRTLLFYPARQGAPGRFASLPRAGRLGIIPEKIGEGKANRVLEALLPADFNAQDVYDNHQLMMKHGQQVCHHHRPDCGCCVLLDICPTGQKRMEDS